MAQLAFAGEGLGVSRQAGRVPAVVTGELARQVRRGLAREGAQEEAAVGAVAGPVRADDLGGRLLGGRA